MQNDNEIGGCVRDVSGSSVETVVVFPQNGMRVMAATASSFVVWKANWKAKDFLTKKRFSHQFTPFLYDRFPRLIVKTLAAVSGLGVGLSCH